MVTTHKNLKEIYEYVIKIYIKVGESQARFGGFSELSWSMSLRVIFHNHVQVSSESF